MTAIAKKTSRHKVLAKRIHPHVDRVAQLIARRDWRHRSPGFDTRAPNEALMIVIGHPVCDLRPSVIEPER